MYLVLTRGIISFYKNKDAARKVGVRYLQWHHARQCFLVGLLRNVLLHYCFYAVNVLLQTGLITLTDSAVECYSSFAHKQPTNSGLSCQDLLSTSRLYESINITNCLSYYNIFCKFIPHFLPI